MYQVWTKEEYAEGWSKVDCGDLQAVQREILKAVKDGKDPLITMEIPFDISIKIKEAEIGKVKESKARRGKGPGPEGEGEVRPGADEPVPELDKGSGDSGPGDSVPGK